jgi:Trp operon repressor
MTSYSQPTFKFKIQGRETVVDVTAHENDHDPLLRLYLTAEDCERLGTRLIAISAHLRGTISLK